MDGGVRYQVFLLWPLCFLAKGGIENTNGRLRRDLPRSTDIRSMSQEEFHECILNYNTTPRKALGWLTPLEAIHKKLHRVAPHTWMCLVPLILNWIKNVLTGTDLIVWKKGRLSSLLHGFYNATHILGVLVKSDNKEKSCLTLAWFSVPSPKLFSC